MGNLENVIWPPFGRVLNIWPYNCYCCDAQIKKSQQKIEMILDSKKIEYVKLDVAADEDAKKRMRDLIGNDKALPPQLFNDDTYCGVRLMHVLHK